MVGGNIALDLYIVTRPRMEGTTDRISSIFSNIAKRVKKMYALYITGNTDDLIV